MSDLLQQALTAMAQTKAARPPNIASQVVPGVEAAYPALSGSGLQVVDSRSNGMNDNRQLEYYPANESWNPLPGKPTIDVFNPAIKGQGFQDAVAADMLHGLPQRDPTWRAYREQFKTTLTPRQQAIDRQAYAEDRAQGETRSYGEWMDGNRVDAYLRGYLFPDANDEWRKGGVYTPQQSQVLDRMRAYLQGRTR